MGVILDGTTARANILPACAPIEFETIMRPAVALAA
jgi:hypothetical protein